MYEGGGRHCDPSLGYPTALAAQERAALILVGCHVCSDGEREKRRRRRRSENQGRVLRTCGSHLLQRQLRSLFTPLFVPFFTGALLITNLNDPFSSKRRRTCHAPFTSPDQRDMPCHPFLCPFYRQEWPVRRFNNPCPARSIASAL